ncbi:MAG TPA: BatD family protein [Phycisphaerae bacterium]|nr:BatD family protein [Phycisphaerae bacterium]HPS53045.1 BatD family protein [Phycisphaerae bacterium]
MQKFFGAVSFILLAFVCVAAQAGSVEFVLSSRETTVGIPVHGQLTIENATDYEQPTLPDVDGLTIKLSPFPSTSSFTQIINGKTTSKQIVSFACEVTPVRAGEFTIPSFDVIVDGRKCSTSPVTLAVNKTQGGDSLLFVEISGDINKAYVGQQMTLTLKIYLKPFYSTRFRRQLTEREMASSIDFNRSTWGLFTDTIHELRSLPQGTEVLRKDSEGNSRNYYLYEFECKYDTNKPGRLLGENINIIVNYPVKLVPVNDFFNDRLRVESRPVSAQASVSDIEILPVPLKGRPSLFNGAVGNYELTTKAVPAEVSVGDPITLTLIVSGIGRLNELPAPELRKIPELIQDFKVPNEPLAGVVKDNAKYFVTSIRPVSDKVAMIPSIPLTFFDPTTGKFSTVSSEPIRIKVKPVEKFTLRKVVSAAPVEKHVDRLTETNIGIYANETDVTKLLPSDEYYVDGVELVIFAAGPAVVLLGLLLKLYMWLMGSESAKRRRNAGRAARGVLSSAETADDVEAAVLRFVADRACKPVAGMTRGEAVAEMKARRWPQNVIDAADEFLGRCEHLRYSGGGVAALDELKKQARKCLREMDRQK